MQPYTTPWNSVPSGFSRRWWSVAAPHRDRPTAVARGKPGWRRGLSQSLGPVWLVYTSVGPSAPRLRRYLDAPRAGIGCYPRFPLSLLGQAAGPPFLIPCLLMTDFPRAAVHLSQSYQDSIAGKAPISRRPWPHNPKTALIAPTTNRHVSLVASASRAVSWVRTSPPPA